MSGFEFRMPNVVPTGDPQDVADALRTAAQLVMQGKRQGTLIVDHAKIATWGFVEEPPPADVESSAGPGWIDRKVK